MQVFYSSTSDISLTLEVDFNLLKIQKKNIDPMKTIKSHIHTVTLTNFQSYTLYQAFKFKDFTKWLQFFKFDHLPTNTSKH